MQRQLYNKGGIMSVPRAQYGFGDFVKSIGSGIVEGVKKVGSTIGDALDKENLDKIAQIAAVIPNPYQGVAQAYTGIRSSGIGGDDYGGLQIGSYTPGAGGGRDAMIYGMGNNNKQDSMLMNAIYDYSQSKKRL